MSIARSYLLYLHRCCVCHSFRPSSWISAVVGWIETRRDQRKMAPGRMIVITFMQVNFVVQCKVGYVDWWEINSCWFVRNLMSLTFQLNEIHVCIFIQEQDFVDRYFLQCNHFQESWNYEKCCVLIEVVKCFFSLIERKSVFVNAMKFNLKKLN